MAELDPWIKLAAIAAWGVWYLYFLASALR